jgi:aspartate/methionine/tyrosine aminotransferase
VGNSTSRKQYDLSWGNAVCVRHAFLDGLALKTIFFSLNDVNLNYTAHSGDARLVEITRKVIERQVGTTYEHIFLTNGATGGVTIAMRAYAQRGHKDLVTRDPPYFPIYPAMIKSAGLRHTLFCDPKNWENPVILWDSPSNPQGYVEQSLKAGHVPIIHDAVYHNKVYTYGNFKVMSSDILIGSYSKLLGLNGIRTGWIATNDPLLAERIKSLVEAEYCGLSSASNAVLLQVLKHYRSKTFWESFETKARQNLDDNRTEWAILEKYFGEVPVYRVGMFYYAPIDKACKRLLKKANVTWTKGSSLGTDDDWGRFNIGQDREMIRDAVKEIIKNDKAKKGPK